MRRSVKAKQAMDNTIAGINENKLTELSIEILKYKDEISEIFENINSSFDRLSNALVGTSNDEIQSEYSLIKAKYNIVKDKLQYYSDDLLCLVQKMKDNDNIITGLFEEFEVENKSKITINKDTKLKEDK